jgi:preprotein translocase subunit SecB
MADQPAQASNKQLLLQKIYIKDLSFESPRAPEVFTSNPQAATQLNIGSKNTKLDGDHFEVTLTLTIESKGGDDTLFLIEIAQAGIFTLSGYTDEERQVLLGTFCPGTLYPFAREAVAEIASKGGFPQLLLQPINFDAVYAQAVQQRQAAAVEQAPVQASADNGDAVDLAVDGGTQGSGETH